LKDQESKNEKEHKNDLNIYNWKWFDSEETNSLDKKSKKDEDDDEIFYEIPFLSAIIIGLISGF